MAEANNAYQKLSKILEWNDNYPVEWINENYVSYLKTKLESYKDFGQNNSNELTLICDLLDEIELSSFVSYPFVADLLHPRTILHSDEDIWPIQAYALSYLTWVNKLDEKYSIYEKPDGFRMPSDSFPIAKRVLKPIPVSFKSNIKFPGMDRGGNDLFCLNDKQIANENPRVTEAQKLIKKWSPPTWKFVAIGTELLAIRGESSEPNKFGSASFRGLAGLNLLINPSTTTLQIIIEAIVHEAIHSLLYQLEPAFGDFFPDKINSKNPVKSPWTGTIITLDNISQACFVWFGLFNFWEKASLFNTIDPESGVAINNIQKIKQGFRNLDTSILKTNLNSDMYASIEYMKLKATE